ncbi:MULTISPECIES: hypothetical protein [Burkholderia]|uniref:Uncharacterized protein n=1 Tax=Burkholderia cepacia TaxID=292 RepID=A0AAQ0FAC8_BURCE|nr:MULTISPECIES: hypothetical protein [Burkholderia]KVQ26878.1 hypothetical protein WK01_05065 [Burkholderia cepacia]RAQ06494.1 hypothetical protein DPR02_22055 [Burkholderia cepacia]
MKLDMETWLIDEGNRVIQKESLEGFNSLTLIERVVYSMWVVDYAVRNSGTLEPMRELYPEALHELGAFAVPNNAANLLALLHLSSKEERFCAEYYERFDRACGDIRNHYNQCA